MNFLKILRPGNFVFVGICVLFGALYPEFNFTYRFWHMIAAAFSAMLIAGAGYVVNDYYDLEIDKINKPHRVLPSGKIKRKTALIYGTILFFVGIILAYFTGRAFCLVLAFINSILLFLYALIFKKRFLSGNLIVSWGAASAFIYGGLVKFNLANSLIIASYAFLYTMLREIVKDIEDKNADVQYGASTLAVKGSKNLVMTVFLIITILMIVITGYYFVTDLITKAVMVLLLFFVILPLIIFYRILEKNMTEKTCRELSKYMKIDMLILLIIFAVGNFI